MPVLPIPDGRLKVSVRTWASIYVDGKHVGDAPTTITLPAGSHLVEVKNDDRSESITLTIEPNKTSKLDYDL